MPDQGTQLELVQSVIDTCANYDFEKILSPLAELSPSSTKAEMVSQCLNNELGNYGFKSHTTPDRTSVFINNDSVCKFVDSFNKEGNRPILTTDNTRRITQVVDYAKKNKVNIFWKQAGLKKKYFYFKQYGFNGVNLLNLLSINTINAAAVAASPVGAAGLTMGGVVALSWSGSIFFATLEHYIPDTMPKTKFCVTGLKFGAALPVRCVEWTSNQIIGFPEKIIMGHRLPTNITDVYQLHIGPKLKNIGKIGKIKKPVVNWLVDKLNKWNNNTP